MQQPVSPSVRNEPFMVCRYQLWTPTAFRSRMWRDLVADLAELGCCFGSPGLRTGSSVFYAYLVWTNKQQWEICEKTISIEINKRINEMSAYILTLELAALQGLVDPEEQLILDGLSDTKWRERIGNAVPPPAAQAIASVMGETLLLAMTGETFVLGSTPIWVRPVATALSVDLSPPIG